MSRNGHKVNVVTDERAVRFEYRVVPFTTNLDKRTRRRMGNLDSSAAAEHLQAIIDAEARDGWEFHSVQRKSVRAPAQFLAWLVGMPPSTAWLDLVIFKREQPA